MDNIQPRQLPVNNLKITVEYTRTPPQIYYLSQMRQFVQDHQHPPGCHLSLEWVKAPEQPATREEELQTTDQVYRHPKGYGHNPRCPVLRGNNHCLCAPCVIALPPDFLKGSCDPHPANDEKHHQLYQKFWGLLNSLGVWRDAEYLQRKETWTVRDDRRDIMPPCILEDIRRRYPSHDGAYRDYMSTFNAETL